MKRDQKHLFVLCDGYSCERANAKNASIVCGLKGMQSYDGSGLNKSVRELLYVKLWNFSLDPLCPLFYIFSLAPLSLFHMYAHVHKHNQAELWLMV